MLDFFPTTVQKLQVHFTFPTHQRAAVRAERCDQLILRSVSIYQQDRKKEWHGCFHVTFFQTAKSSHINRNSFVLKNRGRSAEDQNTVSGLRERSSVNNILIKSHRRWTLRCEELVYMCVASQIRRFAAFSLFFICLNWTELLDKRNKSSVGKLGASVWFTQQLSWAWTCSIGLKRKESKLKFPKTDEGSRNIYSGLNETVPLGVNRCFYTRLVKQLSERFLCN